MENLQKAIRTFNKKEIERLYAFINAPFFKTPKSLQIFSRSLLDFFRANKENEVDIKELWTFIFPHEKLNQKKLNKRKSEFKTIVLEKFLLQEFRKGKPEKLQDDLDLLTELHERNWDKLFHAKLRSTIKGFGNTYQGAADILGRAQVYELAYNQSRMSPNGKKSEAKEVKYLIHIEKLKRDHYLFDKLKRETALENRKRMNRAVPQPCSSEEFDLFVLKHLNGEQPLFQIYATLLTVMRGKEGSSFSTVNEIFRQNHHHFSPEEKELLFHFCVNHFVRDYLSSSSKKNARKLFEWYLFGLAEKLLFDRWGKMAAVHFKHIVLSGIQLEEHEKLQKFIEDHKENLPDSDLTIVVLAIIDAVFAFNQGDFSESLEIIQRMKTDGFLEINLKSIEIKALFELEILDSEYENILESKITAYEKFLQRKKKDMAQRANLELNRLRALKRIRNQAEGEKLTELKKTIQSQQFHDAEWLLLHIEKKESP